MLCQCKKGDDIGSFLEKARQQFPELRSVSADNLMYVKVGDHATISSTLLVLMIAFVRRI
jgi:hypothetical protein